MEGLPDLPCVLYTLVPLTEQQLRDIQRIGEAEMLNMSSGAEGGNDDNTANSLQSGTYIAPAPCTRDQFVGQPLRDAVAYHLSLGEGKTTGEELKVDPFRLLAVVDEDWETRGLRAKIRVTGSDGEEELGKEPRGPVVLLVELSDIDADEDCVPGKFRLRARDAGTIIANLNIANMGLDEFREWWGIDNEAEEEE